MDKMCWACTELYDDSLDECPFCKNPKIKPVPAQESVPEPAPEPKPKKKGLFTRLSS